VDVALELSGGVADVVIENGDLRLDRGLRTAVLVSLFCDARAPADELPADANPRGWWAEDADDPWGSRLWLLGRAKRTPATLGLARGYAATALEWIKTSGVAQVVDVTAVYGPAGELGITVQPRRGGARRWPALWAGEAARELELPGAILKVLPA
jgi:phage gp46-like protein